MKLGLVQMPVGEDIQANLERALEGARTLKAEGAEVIVLPEMFCCPYRHRSMKENAESEGGPRYLWLSAMARDLEVFLIAGSVPEKDGDTLYNTSYVFDGKGNAVTKYRKMHLFDVDIPGQVRFMESQTLHPGDSVAIFETPYGKIGLAICYDIRFPELFRELALLGAQVIVVPAAFNMVTGPAHWELLGRSRAVDNQVYVALCSPARDEAASYIAYGHSLVSDPWGTLVGHLDSGPGELLVALDFSALKETRAKLPLLKHRRPEIYKSWGTK